MLRHSWKTGLVVLSVLATVSVTQAVELAGNDRDGVVLGLVVGHGWNAIHVSDMNTAAEETNHMSAINGALKFGWAWNDALVGFIGMSGWTRSVRQDIIPASATNLNFLAELYYYPGGRGFWLKGGGGVGSLDYFSNTATPDTNIKFKASGFAVTFGTGFEVRWSDHYGLGISYDYTRLDLNDFGTFSGANSGNQVLAVSIMWYGS